MPSDVWGAGDGAPTTVPVKVNGEPVGSANLTDTLGAVANKYSSAHGLKTFNVLVNGSKADVSAGAKTLYDLEASSVELVAKDARGQN
jgi:ABC-type phosphate transport system substrate-binding protein